MIFDFFLFLCVVAGIVTGAWKGLSWQLAGIGSVVLGFLLGVPLSGFIAGGLDHPTIFKRFLVFVLCYGGISLACYVAALIVRTKLEAIKLERYDRHMGAFVGAIHGLALCATASMFLIALSEDARRVILTRPAGRVIGVTLDAMHGVLPDGLHDLLHPYMHPAAEPAAPGPGPAPQPAPVPQPHGDHHH